MKIFLLYTDDTVADKKRLKNELSEFFKSKNITEVIDPSPFFKFEVPAMCGFDDFALILESDVVCHEDPRILLYEFQSGPCIAGFGGKVVLWNCDNAEVRQVFRGTKDVKRYLGNYVGKYFATHNPLIDTVFSESKDEEQEIDFEENDENFDSFDVSE